MIENWNEMANNLILRQLQLPYKILIVGTTGCGKTTLAKMLSKKLSLPHYELDAFHWKPNWQTNSHEEFKSQIIDVISRGEWVVDGNYRSFRDDIWPYATNLIWLDYPLTLILFRIIKRSIRRLAQHEILWNGNLSNFTREFIGHDSILYDSLNTYSFRKKDYNFAINDKKFAYLNVIKLTSPKETNIWLQSIEALNKQ